MRRNQRTAIGYQQSAFKLLVIELVEMTDNQFFSLWFMVYGLWFIFSAVSYQFSAIGYRLSAF
ncbi:MAG TPA: hypothetical protein PKY56_08650 [Candidatus Kapabacteria bacterium]|nr:hypothetical protein [Candidatus Kapabacteria bacterium]HPO62724.1 hypothetical protein [Candidatus Kapabacteria bacterium]